MGADVSGTSLPPLPPGFTLEQQPPPLPPGFALEGTPPPNPPATGGIQNVSSGNLLSDVPQLLGTAGTELLASGAALPRTLAQGVDWLGNKVGLNIGADQALSAIHHPANPQYSLFPDYQTARSVFFGGAGGPNVEFVPQTYTQRRALDAARGVMAGVTAGPESVIPTAVGSVTGGAAAEAFPSHPLVASLLGFIPGAKLGSAIQNAPQRVASLLGSSGQMAEPYGAFVRQGLPTSLSGTTTGNPTLGYAEKLAARMPGSEGAVADARNQLVSAWQDRLDQIASNMGSARTPQELGTSLQTAAQKWLGDFKANTKQLWGDFFQKMPPDTQVPVSNYQQTLTNILGSFPQAPETAGVLRPGTVQSLSDALGVDLKGGQSLPLQAIKDIRSAIGEKIDTPSLVADTSQAALKQIYGSLTRDLEAGAAKVGPDALSSFYKANAATASGHDLLDNYLGKLITATSPENAASYAMSEARRGGTRLGAITFNLPSAAGDLASYSLRNAATNAESPTALANALMGRRPIYSPEAQNVLFPNPQTQADVRDLATVGRAMQPFEKDLANSPTGTRNVRDLGRVITAIELSKEGGELAGTPGRVGGFAAGLMAPNVMGRTAQATALNPYLSALYGRPIPLEGQAPSMLTRALLAPTLTQPAIGSQVAGGGQ